MKRISGIEAHCAFDKEVDVVDLVPHPRNPNKHSDKQIALLAKIIGNQGWRNPIVVSERSGFIVAGHGRLGAARVLNVEKVPVDLQARPKRGTGCAGVRTGSVREPQCKS